MSKKREAVQTSAGLRAIGRFRLRRREAVLVPPPHLLRLLSPDADAGGGKNVTITAELRNGNYRFAEGGSITTTTVDISKATAPTQNVRVVGCLSSDDAAGAWVAAIEQSVAGMVPSDAGAPLAYKAGAPIYKGNSTEKPRDVKSLDYKVSESGTVTATLSIDGKAESLDDVGEVTLPVTFSSRNYEGAIDVVLVPKNRTLVDVSIGAYDKAKTYGDGDFILTATAKRKGSDTAVTTKDGDWWWYSSDPSVLEVASVQGSNTMAVTVKGAGSAAILAWYEPGDGGRQEI